MEALLIPTFLCPKAWESMSGSDRERHCTYCNKSVHNLAAMSARERLALLSSPAARICSRYRVAIRRPAPGRRKSYARHLVKYGAGVALAGSALLVLWEMHDRGNRGAPRSSLYRAVAPTATCGGFVSMPDDWYEETEVMIVGDVMLVPRVPPGSTSCPPGTKLPDFVDLQLDPVRLQNLVNAPPTPAATAIPLPTPAKKKKAGEGRPLASKLKTDR